MRAWILKAKNLGEITKTGSRADRAIAATEIFGSNLYVTGKKARGTAAKPWSLIAENVPGDTLVSLYDAARTYFQGQKKTCPSQDSNLRKVSPHLSPPGDTQQRQISVD
jgi:hypothetical protein